MNEVNPGLYAGAKYAAGPQAAPPDLLRQAAELVERLQSTAKRLYGVSERLRFEVIPLQPGGVEAADEPPSVGSGLTRAHAVMSEIEGTLTRIEAKIGSL